MTTSLEHVRTVLADAILLDGHNDLPWAARAQARYDWDALDVGTRLTSTHTDLVRAQEGLLDAQFWSVFVPSTLPGPQAVVATLEQIDAVHELVRRHPDRTALATTAQQVREITASGRLASLMGAEGGHSIDGSLGVLRMLHRLGVRYMTLTHNENTPWADSATDTPEHGGLTAFGEDVVREMNRIGMIVDLSHVAATTMRDALRVSTAPVMFSHSNALAVCDHPRNVPDDVLEATAANGGVVCVNFVPTFISQQAADWRMAAGEAARAKGIDPKYWAKFDEFATRWQVEHPLPPTGIADVVAHLEHLREVMGIDHVGIGADYDGTPDFPTGLEDVSTYPALFAALHDKGWSDADLRRLAGENSLRVLQAVEDCATA